MQLDEKKIQACAGKRDWYLTIEAKTGRVIVIFRQHSLEVVDAEQFKRDEAIESVSFPAHTGGAYAASGD